LGLMKFQKIREKSGGQPCGKFSPAWLRGKNFEQLIRGPIMVPLSAKTRERDMLSVHHTRTRARSHFAFRILLYSRILRETCGLWLWRGERGRGVLKLHLFLFFLSSAFIFIHPRLSHAPIKDKLARLRAVQSSFVMEISLRRILGNR
jgi:hypothetical protein